MKERMPEGLEGGVGKKGGETTKGQDAVESAWPVEKERKEREETES